MSETFLISDTHFSHVGVTRFLREDGTKLRPWDDINEMDEALITNWNSVIKPQDRIYHLGDVVINRRALKLLSRLNGRKKLIKGNHDIFRSSEYLEYFDDILSYHVLNGMILSHIPVHPSSLYRFGTNIHGHTHANNVLLESGEIDNRYFCVSVEQINYTPISLNQVIENIKNRNGIASFKY